MNVPSIYIRLGINGVRVSGIQSNIVHNVQKFIPRETNESLLAQEERGTRSRWQFRYEFIVINYICPHT